MKETKDLKIMVIDDCRICAMRGRGDGWRQRIEVGEQDVSNALTTAQKDNLLLERNMGGRQERMRGKVMPNGNIRVFDDEKKSSISEWQIQNPDNTAQTITTAHHSILYEKKECAVVGGLGDKKSNGGTQFYQQDRVYYGDIQPAQTAQLSGKSYNFLLEENRNGFFEAAEKTAKEGKKTAILPVTENYRIRKLTPRECWWLMGFTDIDFDKAASVCSNSQLYKQAGNSIVRQVLMAIFSQMNIKGVKPWNEMSDDERRSVPACEARTVLPPQGGRIGGLRGFGDIGQEEIMTKRDIIEAMRDLDDDAEVCVYCTSMDSDGGQYAHDIYFHDVVKGADLQNEITIVAHF